MNPGLDLKLSFQNYNQNSPSKVRPCKPILSCALLQALLVVKLGPEPNIATNPRNPNMECSTFSFRTNSRFRPYPRTSELSLTPQFWSLRLGFRPNFGGRPLTLSLDFNLKPLKPWVWHDTPNPKATELKTVNSENVTQFQSHVAENTILGDTLPKNKNMGCRSVIRYIDAWYFHFVLCWAKKRTHTQI